MSWRVITASLLLASVANGVPTHHRSQAPSGPEVSVVGSNDLVINPDGSYSYSYELSNGHFAYSNSDGSSVFGGYGFKTADGEDVILDFVADQQGFKPRGSHVPEAPAGTPTAVSGDSYSAETEDEYFDANADRSYSFGFTSDEYNRQETADATGNVVGSYSYVDANGVTRTLNYKAGSETGYVPESDLLPVNPEVEAAFKAFGQKTSSSASSHSSSSYATSASSQSVVQKPAQLYGPPAPVAPIVPDTLYSAPAAPVIVTAAASAPAVEFAAQPEAHSHEHAHPHRDWDATYSFGYSSDTASRQENSDKVGNVQGEYSYVTAEGKTIIVKYSAGAEKGFVIENSDELARALESATLQAAASVKSIEPAMPAPYTGETATIYYQYPQINAQFGLVKEYAFAYSASTGSRKETSDADGNIKGSYTIVAADGSPLEVRYSASSTTGFVVENLEEVMARALPAPGTAPVHVAAVSPVAPIAPVVDVAYAKPQPVQTFPTARPVPFVPAQPITPVQTSYTQSNQQEDESYKAYSFGYNAEAGNRQEEADASGNVRGEYSYITAAGNTITVRYIAGPEIGYVIENQAELDAILLKDSEDAAKIAIEEQKKAPKPQVQPQAFAAPAPVQSSIKTSSASHATSQEHQTQTSSVEDESYKAYSFGYSAEAEEEDEIYQPYSFAYTDDAGNRQEQADASGNVKGQYSYVTAEGNTILVQYTAGPTIGFRIDNQEELNKAVQKATADGAQVAAANAAAYKQEQSQFATQQTAAKPAPVQPVQVYTPAQSVQVAQTHHQQQAHAYSQTQTQTNNQAQAQTYVDYDNEEEVYTPYSFGYSGEDSQRQETSDENGNVRGQYAYINAEGNTILVQYSASPETGFVIENEQELTESVNKATADAAVAADSFREQTASFVGPATKPAQAHAYTQTAQSAEEQGLLLPAPLVPTVPEPAPAAPAKPALRRRKIIVRRKKVNQGHAYAQNAASQASLASAYQQQQQNANSQAKFAPFPLHAVAATNHHNSGYASADSDHQKPMDMLGWGDSSFEFKVEGQDHTQQEKADETGERTGSYSYITPEGVEVKVSYRAGRNGFEIVDQQEIHHQPQE